MSQNLNEDQLRELSELKDQIDKKSKIEEFEKKRKKEQKDQEGPFTKRNKRILAGLVFAGSIILALFLGGVPIDLKALGQVALAFTAIGAAAYGANEMRNKYKKLNDNSSYANMSKKIEGKTKQIMRENLDNLINNKSNESEVKDQKIEQLKDESSKKESLNQLLQKQLKQVLADLTSTYKSNADEEFERVAKKLSSDKTDNIDGLLSATYNSTALTEDQKTGLKIIHQAANNKDENDKPISEGSPGYIDARGITAILKDLNNALADYDPTKGPQFKTVPNKSLDNILGDLKTKINSEKTKTAERSRQNSLSR